MTDDRKKSETDPKTKEVVRKEIEEQGKDHAKDKYGVEPGKPYSPVPGDPANQ